MAGTRCSPAYLYLVLQTIWGLLILGLAIGKINGFAEGMSMFLVHFTNWSWALQGFFYLATVAFVIPTAPGRCCDVGCAGHVVALCFLPINAIVWFVAMTVLILLLTDPEFITDLFEAMGAGVVIVGNDVFHTLPVLAIVVYAALQHHLIWYSLNRWFAPAAAIKSRPSRCCALTWLIIYEVLGGALLVAGTYLFVLWFGYGLTVNEVYGTDLPMLAGFAIFVATALLVSGLPLLIMACCYRLFDAPLYPALAERRIYESIDQMGDDEALLDLLARDKRRREAAAATKQSATRTGRDISFDIKFE